MELVVAGWILPILQNYISEIVLDGKEGLEIQYATVSTSNPFIVLVPSVLEDV